MIILNISRLQRRTGLLSLGRTPPTPPADRQGPRRKGFLHERRLCPCLLGQRAASPSWETGAGGTLRTQDVEVKQIKDQQNGTTTRTTADGLYRPPDYVYSSHDKPFRGAERNWVWACFGGHGPLSRKVAVSFSWCPKFGENQHGAI